MEVHDRFCGGDGLVRGGKERDGDRGEKNCDDGAAGRTERT